MTEGAIALSIENKVTAHLGQVELLRTPDPSPQHQPDIAPNDARWCDGHEAPALGPEAVVAGAFGIGEPEKGWRRRSAKALRCSGLANEITATCPCRIAISWSNSRNCERCSWQ